MGYQNEYIINNDVEDKDDFVSKKTVKPVTIAQNTPSEEYEPIPEASWFLCQGSSIPSAKRLLQMLDAWF